jgi:hypothetical protein
MTRKDPHIGDVFAFKAARRWVPLQIVRSDGPWFHIVIYDTTSTKRPNADIVIGAPLYYTQSVPPKNEPMFFTCDYGPTTREIEYLGKRDNRLVFDLPKTFRLSPREEESLPILMHWVDILDRVRADMAKPRPPYHSKFFRSWKIDPRAMRSIDTAVASYAAAPAPYALRMAIRAADHWKDEIDETRSKELRAKLASVAERTFVRNAAKILAEEPKW